VCGGGVLRVLGAGETGEESLQGVSPVATGTGRTIVSLHRPTTDAVSYSSGYEATIPIGTGKAARGIAGAEPRQMGSPRVVGRWWGDTMG
jgi:hypothetical protein